jgi:O-antigen/teichoic acid export membrane protein
MSLFNAARRQRPAAMFGAVENLARPLLVVSGVLVLGSTIEVVLGAITVSTAVTLALLYASMKSLGSRPGMPLPRGIASEMLRYAYPLIPIALLNWTTSVSDRYIIEWISRDTSALGVYAAGYGLISQPFLLMHGVVALTLRPVYFAAVSRDETERAQGVFRVWIATSASICTISTLAIYFARAQLVEAFLGPKYRDAVSFVPWIAFGYLFYVVEQVLEQPLLAHKRTSSVLLAQVCGAVSSVAVTIPFVMHYGAVGAAYACPVYFLIQMLVVAKLVTKRASR